jgi:hypothetical protein
MEHDRSGPPGAADRSALADAALDDAVPESAPLRSDHYIPEHVLKRRAAVQRDVSRLLDDLAPERPPARHDAPVPGVRAHRSPRRCILQSTQRAVTVSWFPGQPGDDSLGELLIIAWRGTVSHPGSAQRAHEAEPLETLLLHPVSVPTGGYEWHGVDGRPGFATEALATHCRALLQE